MRRGFTLIELTFVLAIIGALVALTVPAYRVLLHRAQAGEARSVVQAIAHAEHQRYRDHGAYLACGDVDDTTSDKRPFPAEFPCWRALGVSLEGTTGYRYAVTLQDGSFTVLAAGDLDGDGQRSRFSLRGRDLHLDVQDEIE